EQALPGAPCRGDVFHCLYEVGPLVRYLENRAYDAMDAAEELPRQQARHEWRNGRKDKAVAQKPRYAQQAEARATALADDVATLAGLLRQDILTVAGPDWQTRRELLGWVRDELARREPWCNHRGHPVRARQRNSRRHPRH